MLRILHVPNSLLLQPSNRIGVIDKKIKRLVKEMETTLLAQMDPLGVGLAAVQVGVLSALFIMKEHPDEKTEVFINPRILETETTLAQKKST